MSSIESNASETASPVDPKYLLEIKSVQSNNLRTLFEVLKEVLIDFNIIITDTGVRVTSMGHANIALVHLKLDYDQFQTFYCEKTLVLGVNAQNLFKIIKNFTNLDTVSLLMDRNDETTLILRADNIENNTQFTYKYNLLDLPYEEYPVPPQTFDSEIILPSDQFNGICKMLNNLQAEDLEITSVGQQLILKGNGLISSAELKLGNSTGTVFARYDDETIVQGKFPLNYLIQFSKASGLSKTVQLYLMNDYPLVLSYTVGSLGIIKFLLACKASET